MTAEGSQGQGAEGACRSLQRWGNAFNRIPDPYPIPPATLLIETAACYCKTITGSNIQEHRLDRAGSRRLMAIESAPATTVGRIQIGRPRTSTLGAKLREAQSMVFQECATPTSKPHPDKTEQSIHHAEDSGL